MSVQVSVPEVLSQIAFRMHIPGIATGEFITTNDALMLMNLTLRQLAQLLARLYDDNHFSQTATLATQSGVNLVSLPFNCSDVQAITWIKDATHKVPLRHATLDDLNTTNLNTWNNSPFIGDESPKYQLQGNAVKLIPVPNAVYNLEVTYTSGAPLTVNTAADTVLLPVAGCDEWLICRMCEIITSTRQDKPNPAHTQFRKEAEASLTEAATNRDRNAKHAIQDVRGSSLGDRSPWGYRNRRGY